MVPVTRLPDLCLLALFRQMTLEDQIGARKVCRRWADLVPEATLKRRELVLLLGKISIKEFEDDIDKALFKNRQSLKLLLKADGTAMYPTRRHTFWNSLRLDSLDQATAEMIASTFTGTKELQVAVTTDLSMWDSLAHLLDLWSHHLISLQLFESYCLHIDKPSTTHLFAAINSLSALKHLHLNLGNLPVPVDLSIVSQLEELRFNSGRTTPEQFAQWLQQYGEENQDLARIEYQTDCWPGLEPFTALSEHLRLCFTRLDFFPGSIPNLARICAHFRGLTSLTTIYPSHITPRHLFSHLAILHQLIHFRLIIYSDTFSVFDLEGHHLLPQVKSVKALELKLWNKMPAHRKLAEMKISWTLPNVEVIYFELDNFHCTECPIDNFLQPSERAKSCLRQLFAPLKRDCTKLRLIKHNEEQVHGTAEELLAE